eukprot:TRINITY_DN13709_c0_g1_i1.p1 TRINITY_DN13709_c0_g1~~TRINITY_DN13709_c0_g1_i1.p1  ORF type:complete len:144 (-),score=7.60 TRINITY_DN13709_c0_g1_i1:67-498(-)
MDKMEANTSKDFLSSFPIELKSYVNTLRLILGFIDDSNPELDTCLLVLLAQCNFDVNFAANCYHLNKHLQSSCPYLLLCNQPTFRSNFLTSNLSGQLMLDSQLPDTRRDLSAAQEKADLIRFNRRGIPLCWCATSLSCFTISS